MTPRSYGDAYEMTMNEWRATRERVLEYRAKAIRAKMTREQRVADELSDGFVAEDMAKCEHADLVRVFTAVLKGK